MIIDFHTHIFPDKIAARTIGLLEEKSGLTAATDGTPGGLLKSMHRAGIDMSVVLPVATKPSQFESIRMYAGSVNVQYPGKLLSFGGIHPGCADYKREIDIICEMGLVGIKIHPDYQGVMIDDERYIELLKYADKQGLIILTHAGIDIGKPEPVHCPPEKMRKVLDEVKPKKMVLAHYGGWEQWDEVYEHLAGCDVWLDTSFIYDRITKEQFLKIYQKHDKSKILFATDSPWSDATRAVEWIKELGLPEDETEAIFSGNAKRLLGI